MECGPPAFKVVLMGDGGVGKTTFMKRHVTGEFEKKYVPTMGVEVFPIQFYTNYGQIQFNVWDLAGQEKYGGLRDGYLIQAQAAIIMFDVTSRVSYNNVPECYNRIRGVCGDEIPIIICGNKVDTGTRCVAAEEIDFPKKHDLYYCDISVKSNFHFEEPFVQLAKALTKAPELLFMECNLSFFAPAINSEYSELLEKELAEAVNQPIPDDDDDDW